MGTYLTYTIRTDLGREAALERRDEITAALKALGLRVNFTEDGLTVHLNDAGPTLGDLVGGDSTLRSADDEVAEEFAGAIADELGERATRGSGLETLDYPALNYGPGPKFGRRANEAIIVTPDGRHLVALCYVDADRGEPAPPQHGAE